MLRIINNNLNKLCMKCRIRESRRRRSKKPKIIVTVANKSRKNGTQLEKVSETGVDEKKPQMKTIRIATFNTALFSMAPAVPKIITEEPVRKDAKGKDAQVPVKTELKHKSAIGLSSGPSMQVPRSILKPFPSFNDSTNTYVKNTKANLKYGEGSDSKLRLRVTINLPENEISLSQMRHSKPILIQDSSSSHHGRRGLTISDVGPSYHSKTLSPVDIPGPNKLPMSPISDCGLNPRTCETSNRTRSILEVLREVDADLLALQEVKAEEEKGMKPLSELAEALGMVYVFAESWAPEYGNAILSKWPIKRWNVQKIVDDSDFRNVLKVVVDVPTTGELNFYCTHLDHLNEDWRMKQVMAMMSRDDAVHVLAGSLNSLDTADYSQERWEDIVKFNEYKGKPTPRGDVMKLLKARGYTDAKHFTGECESVVILARGQEVQGTCKYGTRVDYILASQNAPYNFVPGSYEVVSSRGTSDHHIVKVDIQLQEPMKPARQPKTIRLRQPPSKGIWQIK